jgi:hypothetical protein
LENETAGAQVRAYPTNYFLKETAITVPEPAIAIRIDEFRGILPENSVLSIILRAACRKKMSGFYTTRQIF